MLVRMLTAGCLLCALHSHTCRKCLRRGPLDASGARSRSGRWNRACPLHLIGEGQVDAGLDFVDLSCLLPQGVKAHTYRVEVLNPNTSAVQSFQGSVKMTFSKSLGRISHRSNYNKLILFLSYHYHLLYCQTSDRNGSPLNKFIVSILTITFVFG